MNQPLPPIGWRDHIAKLVRFADQAWDDSELWFGAQRDIEAFRLFLRGCGVAPKDSYRAMRPESWWNQP